MTNEKIMLDIEDILRGMGIDMGKWHTSNQHRENFLHDGTNFIPMTSSDDTYCIKNLVQYVLDKGGMDQRSEG